MIELLLQAERALSVGLLDQAERLYRQAADLDPRNSIAVVGLARVALERADDRLAFELAQRALAIDPENAAARRMADRLEEVMRFRGETPPAVPDQEPVGTPEPPAAAVAPDTPDAAAPDPQAAAAPDTPSAPEPRRRSLLDRIRRRR